MSENIIINEDIFEKAIRILENRSFIDNKDKKQILMNGLCQIEHFKTLMRDSSLSKYLYPYLEEFAQQVTYKPIQKGKILFHEGDSVNSLYFVMRGQFIEFEKKSKDDLEQESYWDQHAVQSREQLKKVEQNQFQLQEKKKMQLFEMQKLSAMQQKHNYGKDSARGETSTQISSSTSLSQKQQKNVLSELSDKKYQRQKKDAEYQVKRSGSLEEKFFSEDFKEKQSNLKSIKNLYTETAQYYQGIEYEYLLKIDNKYFDRYFKDNKCVYKKSQVFSAGMGFGELHDVNQKEQFSVKRNLVNSTIVCSENSFLLQMSCQTYQKIFSKLTERINYVFNILANSFPSVKKVILHEFAFQFSEKILEFNQVLFHESEACNFVYIMKGGEIDYRKTINIHGEYHEKRIGMVNQGELFGQEDIFNQSRSYSVYSCVNNSIVYLIKKECLLINQFNSSLKTAVKLKQDYLNKRLKELYLANDIIYDESDINQSKNNKFQNKGPSSFHNLDKTANSMDQSPQKSEQRQKNARDNIISKSLYNIPSLQNIPSQLNIPSQTNINSYQSKTQSNISHNQNATQNYFNKAKNANLGESDYDLAFKSMSKLEQHQMLSNSPSKIEDSKNYGSNVNQNLSKQKNKDFVHTVQTTRAQPQSIYSRTNRPDSAFKDELDQLKKEQAAQQQYLQSSNEINSQQNIQELTQSTRFLSLNKINCAQSSKNEFHINKMPKDMFSLQMQINSDTKLKKKLLIQSLKEQELNNNKVKSATNSPQKEQDKESLNMNKSQVNFSSMPIGSTSSLMKYKEQAKDYFVKDNKPKQLDFFMEFQNYRSAVHAKQLYDLQNRNEIKQDPFSQVDFNVVSNALAPTQQTISNTTTDRQKNVYNINRSLFGNQKNNNLIKESEFKQGDIINNVKMSSSNYIFSTPQHSQKNLNFLTSEDDDNESMNNYKKPNSIQNTYNQTNVRSSSQIYDQFQNNNYNNQDSINKNSPQNLRRSQSNNQGHRKLRFSDQNNINHYQTDQKLSSFSTLNKRDQNDESTPLQIRDIPLFIQAKDSQIIKSNQDKNLQFSNIYSQNQEAESDIRNNFQKSLSFGNLRKSGGLRLGAQLHISNNNDIKLKK